MDGMAFMVNYGLNNLRFPAALPVGDRGPHAPPPRRGRRRVGMRDADLQADLRARGWREACVRGGDTHLGLRKLRLPACSPRRAHPPPRRRDDRGEPCDRRFGARAPAPGQGCSAARWVDAAVAGPDAAGPRRHQGVLRRPLAGEPLPPPGRPPAHRGCERPASSTPHPRTVDRAHETIKAARDDIRRAAQPTLPGAASAPATATDEGARTARNDAIAAKWSRSPIRSSTASVG